VRLTDLRGKGVALGVFGIAQEPPDALAAEVEPGGGFVELAGFGAVEAVASDDGGALLGSELG